MKDFYEDFYAALARSAAHTEFCQRVFGRDLAQHGFADMAQLDKLIAVTGLQSGMHALDIGCGNGQIAEYLSDQTGAHITGLDYIERAVQQAMNRTAAKRNRLDFMAGDINALDLYDGRYDLIISIDSIYFSDDYVDTIARFKLALCRGGALAFFYGYGREPWVSKEEFPADKLAPDKTPLADALTANGLTFESWDFTPDDLRLAKLRQDVLADLKPRFEAEGSLFIYENRMGDANGMRAAIEEGLHRRYLYVAR